MFSGKVVGFIGAGNMGEILIRGLIQSKKVTKSNILACDINKDRLAHISKTYGIKTTSSDKWLIKKASRTRIIYYGQNI